MEGFARFCLGFYFFGFFLGIRNILFNGFKLGLKKTVGKILQPINHPSRFVEHFMIWRHLSHLGTSRSCILDVSSPKLLALFLANRQNSLIAATDLFAEYLRESQVLRVLLRDRKSRLAFESSNACLLCHPANCFDAVYSISVIEHIPNEGDLIALKELMRVVKPGGLLLFTVIFHLRLHQNGSFYSVALFVEQPDRDYLRHQGLPETGALYKGNQSAFAVNLSLYEKKTRRWEDFSDLQAFFAGLQLSGAALEQFLFDNVELAEVVNYMATVAITQDIDATSVMWTFLQNHPLP